MHDSSANVVRKTEPLSPLCVDLDGSLVAVDTFYESFFSLLAKNFFYLLLIPVWLLRGKAYVKQQVVRRTQLDLEHLQFNPAVVDFLKTEAARGRPIYLTTGADVGIARRIAAEIPIFTDVIASDGSSNLTGSRKRAALVERFGAQGFDYLGNSSIDLEIWKYAANALVVSNDAKLLSAVPQVTTVSKVFSSTRVNASLMDYLRIARPDHWFKNIFVFPGTMLSLYFFSVPLNATLLLNLAMALFACCLVASSNYVLNELLDAERDRHHPVKKLRPLAAGTISQPLAYGEWILLGVVGVGLGFFTNAYVGGSCLALWIMGTIYNIPPIRSKELPFLDVLSESINNPIRMAIGWYAVGVLVMPPVSALFAYWMFGAFLMATKRLAEYRRIGDPVRAAQYRKSFSFYDEERLTVGTVFYVALFMTGAVVFMMLYRLELIIAVPFVSYLLAYYLYLGFQEDSPVQYPERLYRDKNLSIAFVLASLLCVALFFVDIPQFRELFVLLTAPQTLP